MRAPGRRRPQRRQMASPWLRESVRKGQFGAQWEGSFPRYVWVLHDSTWYEGRLVNRGLGEYKGYPLKEDELPQGLP